MENIDLKIVFSALTFVKSTHKIKVIWAAVEYRTPIFLFFPIRRKKMNGSRLTNKSFESCKGQTWQFEIPHNNTVMLRGLVMRRNG